LLGGMDAEAEIDEAQDDRPERLEELALLGLGEIGLGEIALVERPIDLQGLRGALRLLGPLGPWNNPPWSCASGSVV
ncbi:MAG: hypothetical protein AAF526_05645, partial [Pseudomonadota bacterium]